MGDRFPFGMRHRIHRTVTTGQGPLSITNSTALAGGTVNSTYSAQLDSTGGSGTYSPGYTLVAGSLPAGITLSTDGLLSGTPSTTGDSTFTIHVEDDGGSTARKAFKQTNVSSAVGMHDYFDDLSTRSDAFLSASLRTQDNIDLYIAGSTGLNWFYDSTNDAARGVTSTTGDADISPQLRFDLGSPSTGTITIIWDSYKDDTWLSTAGGGPEKMYMIRKKSADLWYEMRFHKISFVDPSLWTPSGSTATDVGFTDVRVYDVLSTVADDQASGGWYNSRNNSTAGGIRTGQGSITVQPQASACWIPLNEWYRHVVHVDLSSTDFAGVSYWVLRQGDDPIRVHDKCQLKYSTLDFFAMHYDDSGSSPSSMVALERNVWVGRDLSTSDVASLLSTQSL